MTRFPNTPEGYVAAEHEADQLTGDTGVSHAVVEVFEGEGDTFGTLWLIMRKDEIGDRLIDAGADFEIQYDATRGGER